MIRLKRRALQLMPFFILVSGLLITWQLVELIRYRDNARQVSEFSIRMDELVAGLEWRIEFQAQLLRGVAGFFAGSSAVTHGEFNQYVAGLRLANQYPWIKAFGYIQPAIIDSTQQGNKPAADIMIVRTNGLPVVDSFSNPPFYLDSVIQQTVQKAYDQMSVVMTDEPVYLAKYANPPLQGMMLFFPILPRDDAEQSYRSATSGNGVAFITLQVPELVNEYLAREYPELSRHIRLRIKSEASSGELLYDSKPKLEEGAPSWVRIQRTKELLGRQWRYELTALPAYYESVSANEYGHIDLFGTAISFMLALVTYLLNRSHIRTNRALQQVRVINRHLLQKESLLRAIYDSTSMAVLLIGVTGRIVYANQKAAVLFGCSHSELMLLDYFSLLPEDEREKAMDNSQELLQCGASFFITERRFNRKHSGEFWGRVTANLFRDADGEAAGIVVVVEDISARRESDAAMRLASTVFDASPGGIMVTDPDCRIIRVNKAFCAMTGYAEEDVLGKRPAILASGMHDELFFQQMWLEIRERGRWEGEIMNRHHDGRILPEYLSICSVSDEKGGVVNYVGMLMDISERLKAQERIQYLAHHDYLTGLPNRALLVERAEQALTLAKRYQRQLAIIFMDLDQFKPINDNYGHNVGDKVLCMVAKRLQSLVRRSDTVCRQGGDEFVILIPECHSLAGVTEVAEKLNAALVEPYLMDDVVLQLGVSIGIAVYPENGDTIDALIRYADEAMYLAKSDKVQPMRDVDGS